LEKKKGRQAAAREGGGIKDRQDRSAGSLSLWRAHKTQDGALSALLPSPLSFPLCSSPFLL